MLKDSAKLFICSIVCFSLALAMANVQADTTEPVSDLQSTQSLLGEHSKRLSNINLDITELQRVVSTQDDNIQRLEESLVKLEDSCRSCKCQQSTQAPSMSETVCIDGSCTTMSTASDCVDGSCSTSSMSSSQGPIRKFGSKLFNGRRIFRR